jgi:L-ascorbate metabolism protein UlaG (beta-lactamase superfamily)
MPAPARVVWLGHATVVIELDGMRLITDPVLGRWLGPLRRLYPTPPAELLEGIDVVLLSHLHLDHAHVWSLKSVVGDAQVIAPRGSGEWLAGHGFERVHELAPDERVEIGPFTVSATHADHDGKRHRWARDTPAIGFVIYGSRVVYFAGDTDIFDDMETISEQIDLALIPVGGWGPSLGPGHLDPGRAADALKLLKPRMAVPIHWGSLAMPWRTGKARRTDLRGLEFAEFAAEKAPEVAVHVLRPLDALEIPA